MTTQCPHCGTLLPRDGARFCNQCGTSIPAFSSLQQSSSDATSSNIPPSQEASSTEHQEERKSKPREQIAQQPPSRSPQSPTPDEPPSWIKKLESSDSKKSLPGIITDTGETPGQVAPVPEEAGLTQSSLEEQSIIDVQQPSLSHENTSTEPAEQQGFPASATPSHAQFAARELRVKVWEQEDTVLQPAAENVPVTPPEVVEDQPTRPLLSASIPSDLLNAASKPVPLPDEPDHDQIEQLDTVQMTAFGQASPIPANPPSVADQIDVAEKATQIHESIAQRPVPQQLSRPGSTPIPVQRDISIPGITPASGQRGISMPGITPVPVQRSISSPGIPMQERRPDIQRPIPSTPPPSRIRSRYPLIAVIVLLPVLLLGGLTIWIVQAQPFSVSPVSQPWQEFQDAKLGMAFPYPYGWQVQVDQAKSTVRLADSTNTAQVNIVATNAPGGDLTQYLSQQAKQMQMADAKPGASVSFAHTTWTQVQGTTQQGGANYTTTLLATVHNNRLFTITLLAPTDNYADQEKVNFSHMRNSWRFL